MAATPTGAIPRSTPTVPTRDTSERDLDLWNQQLRVSPTYQQFMQARGLPTNGIVKLSGDQQEELERALKAAGVNIPSGMHIDQGGNLNQKNRLWRNVAIGAAIAGGAAIGAPYIAGALGAGGAGTAGATGIGVTGGVTGGVGAGATAAGTIGLGGTAASGLGAAGAAAAAKAAGGAGGSGVTSTLTSLAPYLIGAGTNLLGSYLQGKDQAAMTEADREHQLRMLLTQLGVNEDQFNRTMAMREKELALEGANQVPNRTAWRQNQALAAAILPGLRNMEVKSNIPGMAHFMPQVSGGLRIPEGGFGPDTLKFFSEDARLAGERDLDANVMSASGGRAVAPDYAGAGYGEAGHTATGVLSGLQSQIADDGKKREAQRREAMAAVLGGGSGSSAGGAARRRPPTMGVA